MAFDFSNFSNKTSIADQSSVSYNGDGGKTTYFGPSSTGASTGLSNVFNNLSSKLGLSGFSSSGSVKGAFGSYGSGIVPQLKDNLGVASPINSDTPENSPSKTKLPGSLQYPKDVGKYFITFTFKDRFQSSPIAPRRLVPSVTITLPIPANLQESFNMSYSDKQLGMLGVLEEAGLMNQETLNKMFNGSADQAGAAAKDIGKKVAGIATASGGATAGLYAVRQAASTLGLETAGAAIDRVTGTVLNPYQELQFEGVSLREHSFSYTFSPNSRAEADSLKKIIRTFKERMHPELNGLLLQFPDQCSIKLSSPFIDEDYYFVQDCYLRGMTVNYAPSGTPAFTKNGEHPAEISISLQFGEIKPLSRNTFTKLGNRGAQGIIKAGNDFINNVNKPSNN